MLCVLARDRKDSFDPGASQKPSAAAPAQRDHVDTNTKPRVHALNRGARNGTETIPYEAFGL
jgi:hypothetical protein